MSHSNPNLPKEDPGRPPENELEGEEMVRTDDAVVGRAFRISAIVLLVIILAVGGLLFALNRSKKTVATHVTPLAAPTSPTAAAQVEIPKVTFTDVTVSAGIQFRHENGATGEKLLPETMGGGVAVFDFDGDGDQDLLFVNSSFWSHGAPAGKTNRPPAASLYRNDSAPGGDLKFADATVGSGFETPFYGMGVSVADFDADGLPDVFLTGVGGARLYQNRGKGQFTDITAATGVAGDPGDWSTASAWLDFDGDGDLDLFVANYVKWSRQIDAEVGYKLVGGARAYGPPMNFAGTLPHLYRNDGSGKFTDVAEAAGLHVRNPATKVPAAKTLGVVALDLNKDGWDDLVVANDTVQNLVFENQKNGTFREVGALSGVAFDSYGNTRGAMGIDAARFTPDGKVAIAIGNFANEMTAFYVAQADPMFFTDEAISWGIGGPSRDPLKFGLFFFDYDLDGRLDLLSANGHLEEEIGKIQHGQRYKQPAQLFWNSGDRGFVAVRSEHAGTDLFQPLVGRGSAYGDFDGDGDLDVVITQVGDSPRVFRNDQKLAHAWVRFALKGQGKNRDALGAWVRLTVGKQTLWRQVATARSYLSASELPVTFGLGPRAVGETLTAEVHWPGGKVQAVPTLQLGQTVRVEQQTP